MKGVVLGSAQHSISRLAPNWQPANPPMTPPATQRITVSARAGRCWRSSLIQAMFAAIPAPRPAPAVDIIMNVVRELAPMKMYRPRARPGPPCQAQGRGRGPAISSRRESRPRERGLIFRWSGYSCLRNCTSPELRVKSSLNETEDSQK